MALLKLLACLCLLCGVAGLFVVFNEDIETPLRIAGAVEVIFAVTFGVMALAVAGIYEHLMPLNKEIRTPYVPWEPDVPTPEGAKYSSKRKLGKPIDE